MKTTALDKLIVAVMDAGGKIKKTSSRCLSARLNGRTVVVYHDGSYRFDFAFEMAPEAATLRSVKAVSRLLGLRVAQ